MSNIYLKLTTEKTWYSQNFHFLSSKNCNLKIRGLGTKQCVWIFYYFYFERNYYILKSMCPCILLNKIKAKWIRKWKIPHTVLERRTLYKNRKLKVKLSWVGARKRKQKAFFVPFILSEGNFFNICVLSECIVYWIHFRNIHTFTYQKTLLHTLFCLFLKSS